MRELSDKQLDDFIAHAMNEGHVTSQQKQRAWEQLQRRAAKQTMLPPLEKQPVQTSLREEFAAVVECLLRWLKDFMFDESVYRRARQQYFWIELYDAKSHSFTMQQRFAYAVCRS